LSLTILQSYMLLAALLMRGGMSTSRTAIRVSISLSQNPDSEAGGKVEILDLPNAGLRGNSHMLMMDKNNLQVAALIQDWLAKQGLVR
jgi:hypothetical protein